MHTYKLVDETADLLARNNLAEEEADRLSRFNAEILGHRNPAQRIMYVDRIRKELAETKQVGRLTLATHVLGAGFSNSSLTETCCVYPRTGCICGEQRRPSSRAWLIQIIASPSGNQTSLPVHSCFSSAANGSQSKLRELATRLLY
ncbi:hypothetical protein EDC04DRAFT_1535466 [Pisolithus marmoratus]|nr:hypothetical protein EDC04DRAFT_1535466 [Pisolithus marmoratus]